MSKTSRNPERLFPPYVANVAEKALRVETFMTENEGDEENFGAWRLETLASYITSLREQPTRMENDWDRIRNLTMT